MAKRIEGPMLLLLSAEEGRALREIVAVPNLRRRRNRKLPVLIGASLLICLVGLLMLVLLEPAWAAGPLEHLMSLLLF